MHAQQRDARVYVDKNIWYEQLPDGSQKWFAIDPDTRETVEIDSDQVYFWTEEWQAAEREADEDVATGRVERFNTAEDFLASLKPHE